jgi:uncharacterized protein
MDSGARPDGTLVARLRAALRDGPAVRLAVLFGSAARGTRRPDSDVDVAILFAEPLDASPEVSFGARLTRAAAADLDVVRLDVPVSTLLKWQIATTGIPLVEATPGEFARFRARAAAEYLDFAPALAHHAEIFRRRLLDQGPAR